MLEDYKNINHHMSTDRNFRNLQLIKDIREQGFYLTGTVNHLKNGFREIKTLKLNDIVYFSK